MESAQRDVLSQWQHSVDSLKDELRSEIIKNNELAYERTSILFARLNAINEANSDVRTIVSRVSESAAFTNSVIPSSYLSFENEFRGSEADIKTRQKYYLSYFNDDNTLDIGCGRGEFLELLREKGVRAIGLELDEQMYHYCTSKGLDVKKMDALCYLASVPDATIGGVFMAQVIEHIEPSQVPVFLQMIYGKLGFGKYLVIETVNLLNVSAFMNFYVDPTHIRPVHPLYLEYLLKACGYRDIKVVYRTYATVPENIDQNKIKEIAPDYAIICKK